MTEDEMVEWHHQLNGHEFEQTPGDSEGQGSLVWCSPWGFKELDTAERLNNNSFVWIYAFVFSDKYLGVQIFFLMDSQLSQSYLLDDLFFFHH